MQLALRQREASDGFADVEALEERLSRPDDDVIADLKRRDGDILVLGATGKMGPTLARMAKRAAPDRKVFAVARYSDAARQQQLAAQGILPIKADLLQPAELERLPDARNVIIVTGYKFGASDSPTPYLGGQQPASGASRRSPGRPAAGGFLHRLRLPLRAHCLGRGDGRRAP